MKTIVFLLLLQALCLVYGYQVDSTTPPTPDTRSLRQPAETKSARVVHRAYDPVTGLFCDLVGACYPCAESEKDIDHCRQTQHKQEMRCPRSNGTYGQFDHVEQDEIRFKACDPEEEPEPIVHVAFFEMAMMALFGTSFVLLKREQRKHMSAFDLRKEPQQRSNLMGKHKGND